MDGLRDCYTEWSKSKREKQISYINAYMCNIEKWYRQPICKAEIDNRHRGQMYGHQGGKGVWNELGD